MALFFFLCIFKTAGDSLYSHKRGQAWAALKLWARHHLAIHLTVLPSHQISHHGHNDFLFVLTIIIIIIIKCCQTYFIK